MCVCQLSWIPQKLITSKFFLSKKWYLIALVSIVLITVNFSIFSHINFLLQKQLWYTLCGHHDKIIYNFRTTTRGSTKNVSYLQQDWRFCFSLFAFNYYFSFILYSTLEAYSYPPAKSCMVLVAIGASA